MDSECCCSVLCYVGDLVMRKTRSVKGQTLCVLALYLCVCIGVYHCLLDKG